MAAMEVMALLGVTLAEEEEEEVLLKEALAAMEVRALLGCCGSGLSL
ncbi:hypothetical protein GS597_09260 [Synechococcales cyanobacterium C]|uniref:Uncharacterized protein n=1 Tax=Petrachloros mirabilis ULC683 TaxID=2781853 RepID=A0A8K1ZWT6_9CYAN|nr:hypothetical protein [Petrachloros mirabilis]NCJ06690.1 hypothetical protein [Petrachloros mirabilis ULC683]